MPLEINYPNGLYKYEYAIDTNRQKWHQSLCVTNSDMLNPGTSCTYHNFILTFTSLDLALQILSILSFFYFHLNLKSRSSATLMLLNKTQKLFFCIDLKSITINFTIYFFYFQTQFSTCVYKG